MHFHFKLQSICAFHKVWHFVSWLACYCTSLRLLIRLSLIMLKGLTIRWSSANTAGTTILKTCTRPFMRLEGKIRLRLFHAINGMMPSVQSQSLHWMHGLLTRPASKQTGKANICENVLFKYVPVYSPSSFPPSLTVPPSFTPPLSLSPSCVCI